MICTEFRSAGAFPHENGGQSLGMLTFEYLLHPFRENETSLLAERLSAPVKAVQTCKGLGTQSTARSMLEIPEELIMTAFKKAEDGGARIIRLFNPTDHAVKGAITGEFQKAGLLNLNEEYQGELELSQIEVEPYKILTIEVE